MRRTTAVALAFAMTALTLGPLTPAASVPLSPEDAGWIETEWGYVHEDLSIPEGEWPTIFTKEGYAGASRPRPDAYVRMDDGILIPLRIRFGQGPRGDYAFVQASIRGTNCAGGQFNLYDRRHAWDGHHIIELIAAQPWSNGRVGMFGSSYPGQTAFLTAATQPPSLKAISANLLHSDIYRDIFMPGGVQNYLFPSLWTYAVGPHRAPTQALQQGSIPDDPICVANQNRFSAHNPPDVQDEPVWQGITPTDNEWMRARAAYEQADRIRIPYYQQNNWHDEQTGPRAVVLFHHVNPDPVEINDGQGGTRTVIPKRFTLSNGSHGFGGYAGRERWAWLDIFLLDMPDTLGLLDHQVVNHFEERGNGTWTAVKRGDSWPFEDTDWQYLYLREGTALSQTPPAGEEPADVYVSVQGRQNWVFYQPTVGRELHAPGGPDEVFYETEPFTEETAIAGPILLELYASIASVDADFFVSLHDVRPDGQIEYLQRGMLKASHREVNPDRSYYVEHEGDQLMVQPWRPHTNPTPVTPGEVVRYDIEVWPVGHIFRPGHRLMLRIHTPPAIDGIWGYTPTHNQPALVTVHHSDEYPSRLLLPVVTPDETDLGPWTACPVPRGFPCYPG